MKIIHKIFLLTLNENLRKEIQEIRREMTNSSEIGRKEIENKLLDINKGIINFQNNSKQIYKNNCDRPTK